MCTVSICTCTWTCTHSYLTDLLALAWLGKPILYRATTAAPPIPILCCSATFAPGTCLLSASPRSCQQSSLHWARPVAPRGWPLEIRPPLGLTTYFPPYVLSPRSTISPALPVGSGWKKMFRRFQVQQILSLIARAGETIPMLPLCTWINHGFNFHRLAINHKNWNPWKFLTIMVIFTTNSGVAGGDRGSLAC